MKWIGAFLLICTTTWIGYDLSNRLNNRSKQIRQLILSLQMLEAEMAYSQLALKQIFHTVSKKIAYPVNTLYEELANRLHTAVPDFVVIWDEEVNHLVKRSSLKKNEQEIMRQFGRNLGQHTFIQQQKHITLTIHHLQKELEEANEERTRYGKMTRSLGILIGLFIVLLLF